MTLVAIAYVAFVAYQSSRMKADYASRVLRIRTAREYLRTVLITPPTSKTVNTWNECCLPSLVITNKHDLELYSWRAYAVWSNAGIPLNLNDRWDSETNAICRTNIPSYAFCDDGSSLASVVSVSGKMSPFAQHLHCSEVNKRQVILVEASQPTVHWMAPGDFDPSTLHGNSSPWTKDFLICFADGEVWRISKDVTGDLLREFVIWDGTRPEVRVDISAYCVHRYTRVGDDLCVGCGSGGTIEEPTQTEEK